MDDFSLLNIFDWLYLPDLLELCDTHNRFRELIIAHYVPTLNIDRKTIQLASSYECSSRKIEIDANKISIYDGHTALQFLRVFGHLITDIDSYVADLGNLPYRPLLIGAYVNRYCADSLQRIKIWNSVGAFTELWKKPFAQLTDIYFANCEFNHSTNLRTILPAINNMEFDSLMNEYCIDHFEHLQHLRISMFGRSSNARNDANVKILQQNQQIQSVHIANLCDFGILRTINSILPKIQHLRLSGMMSTIFLEDNGTVYLDNVNTFELRLTSVMHFNAMVIPFKFHRLDTFKYGGLTLTEQWINFIRQQHNLKVLIIWEYAINLKQLQLILNGLPHLDEIRVHYTRNFANPDMFSFLTNQTNIRKITFFQFRLFDYETICAIIGDKWNPDGDLESFMEEASLVRSKPKTSSICHIPNETIH